MEKYPKIHTLFERDKKTRKVIEGQWNPLMPEFEFLQNCVWWLDEKVDGMNVRIHWDTEWFTIEGRNENASIPSFLANYLYQKLERYRSEWVENFKHPITLYGEGFGYGIQGKMGIEYARESLPDLKSCGFRIFDVMVGDWWLERHNIKDVAEKAHFDIVDSYGQGNLAHAIEMCKAGFDSHLGRNIKAEGFILRPDVDIFTRKGERIIAKLKHKDFAK